MNKNEAIKKIVGIVEPFVKDKDLLKSVNDDTRFLEDLKINSARLVDIVISFEDTFNVEIPDDETRQLTSVGKAADLMVKKTATKG